MNKLSDYLFYLRQKEFVFLYFVNFIFETFICKNILFACSHLGTCNVRTKSSTIHVSNENLFKTSLTFSVPVEFRKLQVFLKSFLVDRFAFSPELNTQ